MAKALLRNNKLQRMASGKAAVQIPGVTCHCCEQYTCPICTAVGTPGSPGYVPPLMCPPIPGLSVTLSGIKLRTEWGQSTLSGTFCCHAITSLGGQGCTAFYISNGPVLDLARGRAYVAVEFMCSTDGITRANAVRAAIVSEGPKVTIAEDLFIYREERPEAVPDWPRTCNRFGYVIQNAITLADTLGDRGGGTVTINGPCSTGDCAACFPTSLFVQVQRGSNPTLSYTLLQDPLTPCSYVGYGLNETGRHVIVRVQLSSFLFVVRYLADAYRLTMTYDPAFPPTSGQQPGTLHTGAKHCDGVGDPRGEYDRIAGNNSKIIIS